MSTITNEYELRAYLLDLDRRLEAIDIAYEEGRWLKNIGRITPERQNALEAKRSALLLDDRTLAIVQEWRDRVSDPLLARVCTVLERILLGARVEALPPIYELRTAIEQRITAFKPTIRGRTVDHAGARQVLREERDRALRREAWLAYSAIAADVEADVVNLLRQRNAEARKLGFENYAPQCLALQGVDQAALHTMFNALTEATERFYREFLDRAADHLGLIEVKPWDLDFVLDQLCPLPEESFPPDDIVPAARAFAGGIGLEQAASGVRVDLLDIPYQGICVTVDVPDDVRILMKPVQGHRYYKTMFHEFGHALHARSISQPFHILGEVSEPGPFCEGMASTLARFTDDPDWLATRPGIDHSTIAKYKFNWRDRMLVHLRLLIAKSFFEYRLYSMLDADLSMLWRQTLSALMEISCEEATGWADNIYLASYPNYLQNYVVAEMIASQTHMALRPQYPHLVGEPAVGAWLTEHYWAPGNSVEWTTRLESATGQQLTARSLVEDLIF